MSKITIKIELSQVEKWDIDWRDNQLRNIELRKLNNEVKNLISDHLGIYNDTISITSFLEMSVKPE